ncbi:hypothetical protein [Metabacillus litoralis]|uniref:hypothetical protein n=1 Tax=Metabacillus litoralis TaxID=152268 RepID=UPI002041DD5C|nr:hypothetical protein [Metabacillus litoralis]MCM3160689.1 hypothetical protein [Metabacillus litoralis]
MAISNFPVKGNLSRDATLSDYLNNSSPMDKLFLFIKEYHPDYNYMEKLEKLSVQFKESLLPRTLRLHFLKPDKSLDHITRENQREIRGFRNDKSWFVK